MKGLAVALAVLALPLPIRSAEATTIRVPEDQPTIQAGIDSASVGDTVVVASGTYTWTGEGTGTDDGLIRISSGITLRSAANNPDSTVIDAESLGRAVRCSSDVIVRIEGLAIRGGYTGTTTHPEGAGIYLGSTPAEVVNCVFTDNHSPNTPCSGGAIAWRWGSGAIENCTFFDNSAGGGGAGVFGMWMTDLRVTNCLFSENQADFGGGFYLHRGTARLDSCEFDGNVAQGGGATGQGGAVYLLTCDSVSTSGCLFHGNSALFTGGSLAWNRNVEAAPGSLFVQGCTFSGGSANVGGGLSVRAAEDRIAIEQSIIAFSTSGEAVYCHDSSVPTFACCDVYGNAGGDWTGCIAGQDMINGNFCADPLFCHATNGNYHVGPSSPCAPDNSPAGCGLIGALPVENCCRVWHVPADAPTIQAGIDSASYCDTVIVACGTYYEHDIAMKPGVTLRSETGLPECVTIDAQEGGSVIVNDHCGGVVIEGLSITGGLAQKGGGIHISSSHDVRIVNCRIYGDSAYYSAGGVYGYAGTVSLEGCVLFDNSCPLYGGAMSCNSTNITTLTDCTLFGNANEEAGGLWCNSNVQVFVENSIIASSTEGPAVYCCPTSTCTLSCSDVWNNADGDWVSCIAGQDTLNNNFSADPLFCDPPAGDFRLWSDSPCAPENSPLGCGLVGACSVGCWTGTLCFHPTVIDSAWVCAPGETVYVDIVIDDSPVPIGEFGFDVTYESSYFEFRRCATGDLTTDWPGISCGSTRGTDTVQVYGNRGGADPVPAGASGTLTTLKFIMPDCTGMSYGDSVSTVHCITNMAYDCSSFAACECRNWYLVDVPVEISGEVPSDFYLAQNIPNPFNPTTSFRFSVPAPGAVVELDIYDIRGRLVKRLLDEHRGPGTWSVRWDGDNVNGAAVSSGIYFCRMKAGDFTATRKMVLMK